MPEGVLVLNTEAIAVMLRSQGVARDLEKRALRVEAAAVRSAHQPGQGRQYGAHTASAPGDPFASDTGTLAASITHRLTIDSFGLLALVGSNDRRMAYLELGTTRIAPRPTLRPALAAARNGAI